ncbi:MULTISPECIES: putative quinol monooxygenase [Alteromonas]|jgi:quinol monooxygenase YgiN|uniref:Quinol monooxygenase n=1 Tax=Alteromonas stellipolaris TaxID=233316 RepID=A0AAW7Z4G5_9ALTE|nr:MULTISPECIES: putative quinol monooxygenase [Alteromonas]AMJ91529.1 hypothetical protein AV940_14205 [Alteromonas sp. Mac2]ALM89644.1 hypothetical protein AOR13_592 [Alteromonas stellipolaris LMG 21856]AMJ75261.1 hypothetical protein AVL57_15600 [Alteromonas stellipolaris]AMJ87667.1 hypothetical protein AV939_14465 [Alteromonas sp. Mac1]AMJ95402.1 hypothetical protein AVL56_14575 [Alteromonas stellipolaris]
MTKADKPVHIVAIIQPQPRYYEKGIEALQRLLIPTRGEPGCIRFDVFEDRENGQYILVEHFKRQADLDFHYAQEYTKSVFALYETILATAPEIRHLSPIEAS